MKVILLQDIHSLGKKFEVKEVSEGYARNFLFPRSLAKLGTPAALRDLEQARAGLAKEEAELKKRLTVIAKKLADTTLEFKLKVDSTGAVFGSVTKDAISKALREHGLLGKERAEIILSHPLKKLGEHRVEVHLKYGIVLVFTVVIRPQG